MNWHSQCAAVLPCRNEAASIAELVRTVQGYLPMVVVVDDGSTDDTGERARQSGAEVLRLSCNQGKGVALRTGFRHAHGRGFAWALAMDGDGQHAPEDIPTFFKCAEVTKAELVIGNRFAQADRMPAGRRFVNRWMTQRLSALCGKPLADSQCGFRLLRLDRWAELEWKTNRFEVESETLVRFARAGFKVEFVPVQTVYHGAGSRINPVADSWRWFRWWLAEQGKP